MSWRFRQSFTVLPGIRVNVSKSGVSATLGAGPLHLNVGPRGTFVNANLPGSGVSYRQRVGPAPQDSSHRLPAPDVPWVPDSPPDGLSPEFRHALGAMRNARGTRAARLAGAANIREIRSASTVALTNPHLRDFCDALMIAQRERDAIDAELHRLRPQATALRAKRQAWESGFFLRRVRKARFAALGVEAQTAAEHVAELEEQLRLATIATVFEVDPEHEEPYCRLLDAFAALRESAVIWDVTASGATDRVRERTAAHTRIDRQPVRYDVGAADALASDRRVPELQNATSGTLFLYPGVVLYQVARDAFAVLEALDVTVEYEPVRFHETEAIPSDAQVVGQTWTYTNKNGTPDRRFSYNPTIPIVAYGQLRFRSRSGLREDYMVSNDEAARRFAAAWTAYATPGTGAPNRLTAPRAPSPTGITPEEVPAPPPRRGTPSPASQPRRPEPPTGSSLTTPGPVSVPERTGARVATPSDPHRIDVKYDRFTDETRVFAYAMGVRAPARGARVSPDEVLNFSAEFRFQGEVLDGTPTLMMQFVSRPAGTTGRATLQYRRDRRLILLVDGASRVDLGDTSHEVDESATLGTIEIMRVAVSNDALQEVLFARRVEGRLGHTEFVLDDDHIAALRELAARMTPDGFETAVANDAREQMRRAGTRAERFAGQALLVRAVEDIACDLPDLWEMEIERVLAESMSLGAVGAVVRMAPPMNGLMAASDRAVIQVMAMEPMLMIDHIAFEDLDRIMYLRDPSGGVDLVAFVGAVDGEEKPLGAHISPDDANAARALIASVSQRSGIPIS